METLHAAEYSCPRCGASDRDRLSALYLKQRLAGYGGDRVHHLLDIAPSLPLRQFLQRLSCIRYRSTDLMMDDVDDRADITSMPIYAEGSFDLFLCSHVLEHVLDDGAALSELYRILKPGGWGILMVPICLAIDAIDEDVSVTSERERWRRFGQYDHLRLYSKQGFLQRVRRAGFRVREIGADNFGVRMFRRCGIARQSVLYVVEKKGAM